MSGAQHTPGPWEVINGTDVYPVGDADGRFYVAHCDPDDAPLSLSGYRPGEHERTDSTYERQMANAALIAAAPEMLKALRLVLDADQMAVDQVGLGAFMVADAAAIQAVRAAIAKAEGRS